MPSYYEMSLENKREYVCQNDFSVAEKPLGSWLVVFLDVDWGAQIEKTDHLRDERASDLSKISWKEEKQWKVEYGQRVASWYHGLKAGIIGEASVAESISRAADQKSFDQCKYD